MDFQLKIAGLFCCTILFSACATPSYVITDPETEIAALELALAGNQATITSIDDLRFDGVTAVEISNDWVSWYDSLAQERAGIAYAQLDRIEVFEEYTYKEPRLGQTMLSILGQSLLGAAILGIWAEGDDSGWGLPVFVMAPAITVPASFFITVIYRSIKRRKTRNRIGVYKFFHYGSRSSRIN